jgi:hypothetical protein
MEKLKDKKRSFLSVLQNSLDFLSEALYSRKKVKRSELLSHLIKYLSISFTVDSCTY